MRASSRQSVRVLSAIAIVAGIGLATPASATAPAIPRPTQTFVNSQSLKATSSTGVPLELSVFVDQYTARYGPDTLFETNISSPTSGEQHLWNLGIPTRSFVYEPATGDGYIHAGAAQITPLGSVRLSIAPAGPAVTTHCGANGVEVTRPSTLTGTYYFDTQSTAWGTVGSTVDRIEFKGRTDVEVDYGHIGRACFGGTLARCHGNINWNSPGGRNGLYFGFSPGAGRKGPSRIQFLHDVGVPNPISGDRTDIAFVTVPKPMLTRSHKIETLSVTGTDGGLITGAATLASIGTPKTITNGCRGGTTKVWNASYTNDATDPLTVHLAMTGDISFPDRKSGANIEVDSN